MVKEVMTSHPYWATYSPTVVARQVVTEILMMLTTRRKESPQHSWAMAESPESIRSRYAKNDYFDNKKTVQDMTLVWLRGRYSPELSPQSPPIMKMLHRVHLDISPNHSFPQSLKLLSDIMKTSWLLCAQIIRPWDEKTWVHENTKCRV